MIPLCMYAIESHFYFYTFVFHPIHCNRMYEGIIIL